MELRVLGGLGGGAPQGLEEVVQLLLQCLAAEVLADLGDARDADDPAVVGGVEVVLVQPLGQGLPLAGDAAGDRDDVLRRRGGLRAVPPLRRARGGGGGRSVGAWGAWGWGGGGALGEERGDGAAFIPRDMGDDWKAGAGLCLVGGGGGSGQVPTEEPCGWRWVLLSCP